MANEDEDPCKKYRQKLKDTIPDEKSPSPTPIQKHSQKLFDRFKQINFDQYTKLLKNSLSRFDLKNIDIKQIAKNHLKNIDVKQIAKNGFIFGRNWIEQSWNSYKMADKAPKGRPMKFPYTYSAKIAQFPLKFHIQNQWMWRYYGYAIVLCFPIFYSIQKLSYAPANVAKWDEIRRKEREERHYFH